MNPKLIQSISSHSGRYQYSYKGCSYTIIKIGGLLRITNLPVEPVTPVLTQLKASITRRFFIDLELQRQALMRQIYASLPA